MLTPTLRASVGPYSEVGKGKRKSHALQSAARALLVTLKDVAPSVPEILNSIPFSNFDQFILNQKLLLELERAACVQLLKKDGEEEGREERVEGREGGGKRGWREERVEVGGLSSPQYGGTLVTLHCTSGVAPTQVWTALHYTTLHYTTLNYTALFWVSKSFFL